MKFVPEKISTLEPNQIFVFGSNTEGRHGKGAALIAKNKFGAVNGKPYGIQGQSYAVITTELRRWKNPISLGEIEHQINILFEYASSNPDKEFLVTKLGTSLAGFTVGEMYTIFQSVINKRGIPKNIILPKEFIFG